MTQRVSVGMSFKDGAFIAGLVLAPLFAIGAILVIAVGGPPAFAAVVLAIGIPFALLVVIRYRTISKNRRWLTPTESGFVLTNPRGEFEFTDEMVSDLATWAKVLYANGQAKKTRRTGSFVITAGESAVEFEFTYDFPLGGPDPLGDMLNRIFDKLATQTKSAIQAGDRLSGKGWSLDRNELLAGSGREEVSVPLREVAAVDITDGKVCVWRKGNPEAVLRIPAGSPNALVMGRVLQDLAPPPGDEESGDGLGRVIFERDKSIKTGALLGGGLLSLLGALVGCGLIVGFFLGAIKPLGGGVGLFILLLVVTATWSAWTNRVNIFRCHSSGVSHTTPRGVHKLRYGNVGSFSYSGIRQFVNGAYTGTTVNIRFEPLDPTHGEPIRYSATFKNADDELDNLRDFISRVIAGHMHRRLRDNTPVRWCGGLVFHLTGLELRRSAGRFRGKLDPEIYAYERISSIDISQGVFRLALDGEKKWAVEEQVSQSNFFPGYVLLMTILHPTPATDQKVDASPEQGAS